jgi:CDGSH-type Zn-finger protein
VFEAKVCGVHVDRVVDRGGDQYAVQRCCISGVKPFC